MFLATHQVVVIGWMTLQALSAGRMIRTDPAPRPSSRDEHVPTTTEPNASPDPRRARQLRGRGIALAITAGTLSALGWASHGALAAASVRHSAAELPLVGLGYGAQLAAAGFATGAGIELARARPLTHGRARKWSGYGLTLGGSLGVAAGHVVLTGGIQWVAFDVWDIDGGSVVLMNQGPLTMIVAASGVLAAGITYRLRHHALRQSALQVAPSIAASFAGLSLSGRL